MTRGTIALIGPIDRETELVSIRLEKESFLVAKLATAGAFRLWLGRNHPQAVLLTSQCSHSAVDQVLTILSTQRKHRYLPAMALASPATMPKPKGLGDIFDLHQIPLAQVVARLRFAIQLSQMAQQLRL